jgi:hypothetical protein
MINLVQKLRQEVAEVEASEWFVVGEELEEEIMKLIEKMSRHSFVCQQAEEVSGQGGGGGEDSG